VQEIELLSPHILLLDISLVGYAKRGDEICRDTKAFLPTSHIPIILLSAEKDLRTLAIKSWADNHLGKPFGIDAPLLMVQFITVKRDMS
jgi:two-component system response regulator VicR